MDKYKTPQIGRRTAEFISASAEFGRPMLTSPGTPADRVKILREAYAQTMKDPVFIAQADKSQLILEPSSGEELQALANRIMDQPSEVIQRVRKVLNE
jgi:tripartite-type tricarboxylate transporter receptor subunit TctC